MREKKITFWASIFVIKGTPYFVIVPHLPFCHDLMFDEVEIDTVLIKTFLCREDFLSVTRSGISILAFASSSLPSVGFTSV